MEKINYKDIIIPTVITGLIAGLSEFITNQKLGWKTAAISASIAFLITVAQEFNRQFNPPKGTEVRQKSTKLLVSL